MIAGNFFKKIQVRKVWQCIRFMSSIVSHGLQIKITRAIPRRASCGILDPARLAIPGVVCSTRCTCPTGAMQRRSLFRRCITGMCSGSSARMSGVRIWGNIWRIVLAWRIPGQINYRMFFFIVWEKRFTVILIRQYFGFWHLHNMPFLHAKNTVEYVSNMVSKSFSTT